MFAYSVMFKHLSWFDSFVADIGLHLSCFSTGIKSVHALYKTRCKNLVCSIEQTPLQRDALIPLIPSRYHRCLSPAQWVYNLWRHQSQTCNQPIRNLQLWGSAYPYLVLKNETRDNPLKLFLGSLIFSMLSWSEMDCRESKWWPLTIGFGND